MPKSYNNLKLLLIQIRDDATILKQEQQCFIDRLLIKPAQLHSLNICAEHLPENAFDTYDAIFIGGSGIYSATENYPWTPALLAFIQEAESQNMPMFGSCFGHQIIARALGGSVIHDEAKAEMGCFHVTLTEAGQADELYAGYPARFKANMGHKDRVNSLPAHATELAISDTQGNQAFCIKGKPIYGTQFHSELDAKTYTERINKYIKLYPIAPDEKHELIASLAETTEVDDLMHRFLLRFVSE